MSTPKLPELYAIRRVKLRHAAPGSFSLTTRLPYLPHLPDTITGEHCQCGIVTVTSVDDDPDSTADTQSIISYLDKEGLHSQILKYILHKSHTFLLCCSITIRFYHPHICSISDDEFDELSDIDGDDSAVISQCNSSLSWTSLDNKQSVSKLHL